MGKRSYGSLQIGMRPGDFKDDEQKELVFTTLQRIGFIWNEEKKIWWKPGVKTIDGEWVKKQTEIRLKKGRKRKQQTYYGSKLTYPEDVIIEWIAMRDRGVTYTKIADKHNVPMGTIYRQIRIYENRKYARRIG